MENKTLEKRALEFNVDLDLGKVFSAIATKAPESLPYAAVSGALGGFSGIGLGDHAKVISGKSGGAPGFKRGLIDSAVAGSLAGTALQILRDPEVRATKEGKAAAALLAALSAVVAWRKPLRIMTEDPIEKRSSLNWRTVILKNY